MMGIAREDEGDVLRRTNAMIGGTDPEYAPRSREELGRIVAESTAYADRLLDEHRRSPRGDLVDGILDARVDGEPLSRDQQRAFVTMYIGGRCRDHAAPDRPRGCTPCSSGRATRAKLVAGADAAVAVEEMLRFVTPIMHHARWPLVSVDIAGRRIEPDQRTTLWMISANRDPAVFDDPDRFDVERRPNHHDALGPGGPHFCLGAGLARMEARVLFEELRPWLGRIEPDGPAERGQSTMFNLMKHLPVRVV